MLTISVVLMPNYSLCLSGDLMRLRDATTADVSQMLKLEQESSAAAHWGESSYQSFFKPSSAPSFIRVAEDDSRSNELRGFLIAGGVGDEWEIESLVVDPLFRRQGLGSCLVSDFMNAAREQGIRNVLLEVRESNEPARRLYEKIGFSIEGRRKDYYRNPNEDAILYRLSLRLCDKIS